MSNAKTPLTVGDLINQLEEFENDLAVMIAAPTMPYWVVDVSAVEDGVYIEVEEE